MLKVSFWQERSLKMAGIIIENIKIPRVHGLRRSWRALPLTNLISVDDRVKAGILMPPGSDTAPWRGEKVIGTLLTVFRTMYEGKNRNGC